MWIFRNAYQEICALYGLPLLIIASSPWWYNKASEAWLLLLVAIGIDSAHVYATSFRTWFNPDEMKRSGRLHLLILSAVVALSYGWCVLGLRGFWSFVLYFTLFHHIRQFYGMHRLSLARKERKGIEMGRELYALTGLPFIAYHFRGDIDYNGFFTPTDMWRYPHEGALYTIYALLGLAALSVGIKIYRNPERFTWPAFASVLFPAVITNYCFLISREFFTTILPILCVHGITYYFLTAKAQLRFKRAWWPTSSILTFGAITLFCALMAALEYWFTENKIYLTPSQDYAGEHFIAFGVAIATAPALYHYIVDGFLWRRNHPEFKTIFAPTPLKAPASEEDIFEKAS